MSTRKSAPRNPHPPRGRDAYVSARFLLPVLFLAFFPVPRVFAQTELIVLNLVLNQEPKGEHFVASASGGDFLVKAGDLKSMGIANPAGTATNIDGEPYFSLRSIPGIRFALDERTLTLDLVVPPELLPKRIIDFQAKRPQKVSYPKETGGFLNYGIGISTSDSSGGTTLDGAAEIGIRSGDAVFLSDASYQKTPDAGKFVRLQSSVTLDRREDLKRVVFGDFFASSGNLGGNLNLGGVSASKVYRMDPYLLRNPLAEVSGTVSSPSDAEVYVNGIRVRREKLFPGVFELRNLPNSIGVSDVSVVIKDAFGRTQALTSPFYFSDQLLRKGFREYSGNAGFLREKFGEESNKYGAPAVSGYYRAGRSDSLTLGGRAEGGDGAYNAGPEAVFLIPGAGAASAGISAGYTEGRGAGLAVALSHSYQDNSVGTRAFLSAYSREYGIVGEEDDAERVRFQAGAGINYGTRKIGSFTLGLTATGKYLGQDTGSVTFTYSKPLPRDVSLLASISGTWGDASGTEAFLGLTWFPRVETTVSASYRKTADGSVETLQAQKNPPAGEGTGGRITIENSDAGGSSSLIANPYVQYNSRYGILSAEYKGDLAGDTGGSSGRVAVSGAVATVDGTVGFCRPVQDSFVLARLDGLKGVRVYQNNQEIGRTDARGEFFLPGVTSYTENQITIDDKDIPIEYMLSEVTKYVSPPLRSGSVVRFDARKFQAASGFLKSGTGKGAGPVEYADGKLRRDGGELPFTTGRGGEFYLEMLPPGIYEGSVAYGGGTCFFTLAIPRSDEMTVDLGEQACEAIR